MNHKLPFAVTCIFQATLLVAAVMLVIERDLASAVGTMMVFVLMYIPSLLRRIGLYLPPAIEIGVTTFLFGTFFLGHIVDFYERYYLWDKALHFESGLVLSAFGFTLVYILNEHTKARSQFSPIFIALFVLSFSLSAGVVWEILEFIGDGISGADWQSVTMSKNFDTMWDLIADGTGALIVSVAGYAWMRRHKKLPFKPWRSGTQMSDSSESITAER